MGYYFEPPKELPLVARRIQGLEYEELQAQLKDGERPVSYTHLTLPTTPYV